MYGKLKWLLMNQEGEGSSAGGAGDGGEGEENNAPTIDPAEYEGLKTQLSSFQESIAKLEANNKALMQEKVEARKAAEKAAMEAAKKSGDVEAVEKSWSEKFSNAEREKTEIASRYEKMIEDLTVGAAATRLAAELDLNGNPEVLLPHVSTRLKVEIKDDKPVVRVLDKEGRPSAMTIKELQAEFMANPVFAHLVKGSKGSGSGFGNSRGNWNGGDGTKLITRGEYSAMDAAQKAEISQSIRTGKVKLVEARS